MRAAYFLAISLAVAILAGCGGDPTPLGDVGGDEDSGSTPVDLTGVWYGTISDGTNFDEFEITIAGSDITSIRIAGADAGITGVISARGSQIYNIAFDAGGVAMLVVDASQTHAVTVDPVANLGVLQLAASSLPTYDHTDIDGNWAGLEVAVNDGVNYEDLTSTANCGSDTCAATFGNGVTLTATLTSYFDATAGVWGGAYVDSLLDFGFAEIILSADGQFAGGVTCEDGAVDWTGCAVSAWTLQ